MNKQLHIEPIASYSGDTWSVSVQSFGDGFGISIDTPDRSALEYQAERKEALRVAKEYSDTYRLIYGS